MGQPPSQDRPAREPGESALTITVQGREFDVTPPFSNRELHLIKQISGVRAGEFEGSMEAGDNDLLVALAHVAVRRTNGNRPTLDELWDLPAGEIGVAVPEDDEPEADPTPPARAKGGSRATTQN